MLMVMIMMAMMMIKRADARHTERICRFSRRKQGTRRGNAVLVSGSKAHREDVQI